MLDVIATVAQRRKYYAAHFPRHLASLDRFLDETKSESLRPSVVEEEITFWVALMAYARLAEKERIRKTFGDYGIASAGKLANCGFSWNDREELLVDSGKSFGFLSRKSDVIAACRHTLGLAGLDYPDNIPMLLAGNVDLETYNRIKAMYADFTTKTAALLESSSGGGLLIAISLAFVNVLNNGVNKE
ncbi:MAG: hypothetical protein M3Q07_22195 [Pseudobdellovibrionaceae bacterium]|nr:hypothetical protein [Pseudobdellovibrionaceae bacterium]